VPLAQVRTHYKIGKLNLWTLFCNVYVDFLNSQIWKEIMLELNGNPWSVTRFSIDSCFQLNFQQQISLKNQHLPHSESKSYQINSIKFCSSRCFQQHQRHIPIPPTFSATITFNFQWRNQSINIQELLRRKSWNQANAPLLLESFPNKQRTWFEASWFGESHKYKTKQTNYLTS